MKYREMFPNCFSGQGAISAYSQNANCPWYRAFGEDTPTLIETMFAVRSSEKVLTSVIAQFDSDNPAFRFVWLGVFSQFQQKWKRLFDDYATDYSPIDGYVVNETGTRKENNTGKDTTKYGKVVDVSGSDSGTVKDDTTSTDSNLNSGYGFNSVDGVPTDKSAGNSTDNTTTTRNLQSTGKNSQSGQDEIDKSEDRNENYTIKKTGNIGYSMPQELLQADFDLWATTYFSRIFEDIENAIFITVYDCEPIRIISKQNGYILPVMTESVLGGGKAVPKTDDMNYKVGVDADGNLWYKQEQSKTKVVKFVRSTVDNSITSDTTNDEILDYLNSSYVVSAVLTYVPGTDFYMTPGATVGDAIAFDSYTINGVSYSVTWNETDAKWVFATHESSAYTLPVMSNEVLGGGKAVLKTDSMTEEVGVDENGQLWYSAGVEVKKVNVTVADGTLSDAEYAILTSGEPFFLTIDTGIYPLYYYTIVGTISFLSRTVCVVDSPSSSNPAMLHKFTFSPNKSYKYQSITLQTRSA